MALRAALVALFVVAAVALLVAGCKPPATGTETGGATITPKSGAPGGPGYPAGPGTPAGMDDTPAAATAAGVYPSEFPCVFDADCKWLEEEANREMNSALSRQPEIDVVYAHNDPSAHGAYTATKQEGKGREKTIKFIGIDALASEGIKYVKEGILAATFQYQTGGDEAIKAAVRILGGQKVPQNITLGTRVFTPDNVAAGGEAIAPDAIPGRDTPDALDKGELPKLSKTKYLIGYSQCNGAEPWRKQMDADVAAAAAKYPEFAVLAKDAQNKSEDQQAQVREFIQQKVDLIIISPKEAKPLTAPVEEAMKAGIPVIVLDRKIEGTAYTCFIGGDNVAIGREAGKWVKAQFPSGGKVVELKGLMTSTPAQERHLGFLEGLRGAAPGTPMAGGS